MLVACPLRSAGALALALLLTLTAVASAADRQQRIKNGTPAANGQYPWTVALLEPARDGDTAWDEQTCGGTLVAPDVVITAAHCVADVQPGDLQVLAGVTTLSTADADDAHRHDVAWIAMHPQEDVEGNATRFDAAVVKLATPVPGAKPIAGLVDASTAAVGDGAPLTVSGWGRDETDDYPTRLRFANIPSVSDAACDSAWDEWFSSEDMICALKVAPTVIDACDGDSGGPLVTPPADPASGAGVKLAGIVSYGSGECDDPDLPGVYARVQAPAIHDWLAAAFDGDATNDPRPKPGASTGAPVLSGAAVEGQTLTCTPGTFTFDAHGLPATTTLELLRLGDDGDVLVGTGAYTPTAADIGSTFACRAVGRITGAGGRAAAFSSPTAPVQPRPVVGPPIGPGPGTGGGGTGAGTGAGAGAGAGTTVPPTGPAPVQRDTTLPHVDKVVRRCTRKRSCTFTVTTSDVGTGVTALRARLSTTVTRTCKRKGKRVRCTKVQTRTVRTLHRPDGTFSLAVQKLAKGRYTLTLTAFDGAANRTESRVRFTLR